MKIRVISGREIGNPFARALAMMRAQREELEDIKVMLAATQGKTYERREAGKIADLRELHPRGKARYEEQDVKKRMAGYIHSHHPANGVSTDANSKDGK